MIRDITIGQYYPADSLLHRADPRVKLVGTLVFIISLFVANDWIGYLFACGFLALTVKVSKVPFSYIVRGLKAVIILLLISASFNIFFTDGEVLWKVGFVRITKEGLRMAFFMAMRLSMLIMGSSLMTFTTTPNQLTDGMETGLGFLKKIHVPVHELAMIMSIALRFIPILVDETDKIMKAQMARGADFESGNLMTRVKSMIPILVPLFISAFRRASDLALAMEARCYQGGDGRTKMKPLKYEGRDGMIYLVLLIYLAAMILIRVLL